MEQYIQLFVNGLVVGSIYSLVALGFVIIYKATKRFIETLSNPSVKGQRVVLINFPSSEMKAVGLVTRVLIDTDTGKELAAVYVPTSPNPTSAATRAAWSPPSRTKATTTC